MRIEDRLDLLWELYSRESWDRYAILTVREFPGDANGNPTLIIVHNTLRDHWEMKKSSNLQGNTIQKPKICVLDDPNNESENPEKYTPYGTLLFKINQNPTLKHHIFAKTPDHREEPRIGDHATIISLVESTGYAAFLNLRRSGAGLPYHLHFQGQLRKYFPLLKHWDTRGIGEKVYEGKNFQLHRHAYPNYGVVISLDAAASKQKADTMLCEMHQPIFDNFISYNLLYDKGRIAIFPRRNETAQNVPTELEAAGMKKWQIAGQEMGHLFTAKYKTIADSMTREALIGALQEVTLVAREEQMMFEDLVTGYTRRHDR